MSELGEVFRALRENRQADGSNRRLSAEEELSAAQEIASASGVELRQCSWTHYQLSAGAGRPLLNIYPGNRRIYSDPNRRWPFVRVRRNWSLVDVVQAAIKALEGEGK